MNIVQLRKVTEILSHIDILLGIAGLVGGIILLVIHYDFKSFLDSFNIYSVAYSLLITIGAAFLIAGGFGMVAHRKKNDCMIQTKNVIVYIFFIMTIVFIIIQGVSVRISKDLKNDANCTKESFLIDYKSVFDSGKNLLCNRDRDCPCNAASSNFNEEELSHFYINNKYGASMVSQCPEYLKKLDVSLQSHYNSKEKYIDDIVSMMRAFESTFKCSGFCSLNSYFVFKDMNSGRPENKDCKVEFVNFLEKNLITSIILTSILLVYLFISAIFTTWLIWKKDKNYGFFPENNRQQSHLNLSLNPLQQNNNNINNISSNNNNNISINKNNTSNNKISLNQQQQLQFVQIPLQKNKENLQQNQQNQQSNQQPPYSSYDPPQTQFQTPFYVQGQPEILNDTQKEMTNKNVYFDVKFDTPKLD